MLQQIRNGFGPKVSASEQSLAALHTLAAEAAKAAKATAPAPVAKSAPAETKPSLPPQITIVAGSPEVVPTVSTVWTWETLEAAALNCTKCEHLVRSRTQVVFGVGNRNAELMFVGEAPGADEDLQGEPFVGKAGQLLTKIIQAMGYSRDDVYIANILKCRPDMPGGSTGNRKPKPEEMQTCIPWLEQQIALVKPKAMVALGATAVEGLLGSNGPVGKMRGKWFEFRGIPVMATYHPAYLLRNQLISEKRKVWEDMLLVLEHLGRPISEKQRRFFTQSA
ncbi:uracil-DNA glycosylase [Spartobacteria bacterium LR76]|nr:uracil-DNA glycosylase [Spartobacteria bacterium LR76]